MIGTAVSIGLGLISGAIQSGKIGVDPDVLAAIENVEQSYGLTPHVKEAYNAYDGRFNDTYGQSYVYYAEKHFMAFDSAHWAKMVGLRLGNIQDHLEMAVSEGVPISLGGVPAAVTSLFKNPLYIAALGLVVVVIVFLSVKSRRK